MLSFLKRTRTRYILQRYAINHHLWEQATGTMYFLEGMSSAEKTRLRELSTLFLHYKKFIGVDISVTPIMRVTIAAQACLPIFSLGLGLLGGWNSIIIYPGAFQISRNETDEYGIVHHSKRILIGEAWLNGSLVLSWDNIVRDLHQPHQGYNVVIHEIAHKLDMLNGRANGMPPLPDDMQREQWSEILGNAYELLNQRLDRHQRICVNAYASISPAEFFAVFSEYFFCAPEILQPHFTDVYHQLRLYYRQDTLVRHCQSLKWTNSIQQTYSS